MGGSDLTEGSGEMKTPGMGLGVTWVRNKHIDILLNVFVTG